MTQVATDANTRKSGAETAALVEALGKSFTAQRLNPFAAAPALMQSWLDWGRGLLAASRLEHSLTELVKIRASQINGCAVCLQMHTADARKHGETEERIYLLDAWHESPLYSERERAALAWTEALTQLLQLRRKFGEVAPVSG